MLKVFAKLYKHAVLPEACERIISSIQWGNAYEALVEQAPVAADPEHRKTDVVFIPPDSGLGQVLQAYIRDANQQCGWNFDIMHSEPIQVGRYTKGSHYNWHIDTFPPDTNNLQRKLTAVLFLSDPSDFEGGEFEFTVKTDIPARPEQGDIVVFPSVLNHRVLPVISGTRYSAASWMIGPAFR